MFPHNTLTYFVETIAALPMATRRDDGIIGLLCSCRNVIMRGTHQGPGIDLFALKCDDNGEPNENFKRDVAPKGTLASIEKLVVQDDGN